MKISATWSSSRIATRVSWALEEMIISLLMPVAPTGLRQSHRTDHGRTHHHQARQHDPKERCDHNPISVGRALLLRPAGSEENDPAYTRLIGKSTHPHV